MSWLRRIKPGLRGRLLLSVLATIALVLAGLAAAFNLILDSRLQAEADSTVNARATAELSTLNLAGGRIELREAPDQGAPDAGVWVFQGQRPIEQPQTGTVALSVPAALAQAAPAKRDVSGGHIRLASLPVVAGGRRIGAVVAGISLAPYRQTQHTALVASVVLALVAFITVALAANWLIAGALRPITRMTRLAARWSEQDIDRRFAQGPPHDEFTELAFTLDGLLDRLALSLRHEQRLSAELSHELRTPLANVAAQAQYALIHTQPSDEGEQALRNILSSVERMTKTLDTLIAAARGQLDPHAATSDARAVAQAAANTSAAHDAGVAMTVAPSEEPLRVAVEEHLAERIVAPILENASRHASGRVLVEITGSGTAVRFTITDDGPGVPQDEVETIFEPGYQSRSASPATVAVQGAGLGLALARRLARAAGGDVRAVSDRAGGRFTVELPRAR